MKSKTEEPQELNTKKYQEDEQQEQQGKAAGTQKYILQLDFYERAKVC